MDSPFPAKHLMETMGEHSPHGLKYNISACTLPSVPISELSVYFLGASFWILVFILLSACNFNDVVILPLMPSFLPEKWDHFYFPYLKVQLALFLGNSMV